MGKNKVLILAFILCFLSSIVVGVFFDTSWSASIMSLGYLVGKAFERAVDND